MICDITKGIYYDDMKISISKEQYIEKGLNEIITYLNINNYNIVEFDSSIALKYYKDINICPYGTIMYENIKNEMEDLITKNIDLDLNVRIYGIIDVETDKLISISLIRLEEDGKIDSIYFDSSCSADTKSLHKARIKKANYFLRAYIFLYHNKFTNIKEIRGDIFSGNSDFLIKYHINNKCIITQDDITGRYKYNCEICAFLNNFFKTMIPNIGQAVNFSVSILKNNTKTVYIKNTEEYVEIYTPQKNISFKYYYNSNTFYEKCKQSMLTDNEVCIPSKKLIARLKLI